MEDILCYFREGDAYAASLGIELLEVSAGWARARLAIEARHLNSVHTAHGGVIFGLADLAFAAAANSHGTVAMGINASIAYVKAVSVGTTLYAEAREISLGPRLATYSVEVSDDRGEKVASFQGMVYRKRDPLALAD
jgi:acyl-CoA thioesterase